MLFAFTYPSPNTINRRTITTAISLNPNQSYQQSLNRAAKVNWQIEDIIGGDNRLDFTRRFMPEAFSLRTFSGRFRDAVFSSLVTENPTLV